MKRRQALKSSAAALMGMGAWPTLSMLFQSCGIERLTDYQPQYLSIEQFDTIWKLADLMLPETDTPGAAEAGVAPYIDLLCQTFFGEKERTRLESGLSTFMEKCSTDKGKPFLKLENQQQMAFLNEQQQTDFFNYFKELVLWAFFTSEVGMKSMNYQPIPGKHEGCITIDGSDRNLVGNR